MVGAVSAGGAANKTTAKMRTPATTNTTKRLVVRPRKRLDSSWLMLGLSHLWIDCVMFLIIAGPLDLSSDAASPRAMLLRGVGGFCSRRFRLSSSNLYQS